MRPLYTSQQIRDVERRAAQSRLMERAGLAAADLARDLLADAGGNILVVAGPGNNGGDAFVAARHLRHGWHQVTLLFAGEREHLPPDAAAAHDAWLACGGSICREIPTHQRWALVIDGLFGIGLTRAPEGQHAALVAAINALPAPVLALDLPSGLCADTGRALGGAVRAAHTLTFIGAKPGLYTLEGPDHAGRVHVCDLDLAADSLPRPAGHLLDAPPALPTRRRHNSHKGSHGSVGVLGGDGGMLGAALLAARAALLIGAGRVYAGLLAEHAPPLDTAQPELMLRSARALLDIDHLTALAVGPGLGRSGHAAAALQRALHYPAPLLLDADALHLLGDDAALARLLRERAQPAVVTPHPGEAAALLGCSVAEVQRDRIAAALSIARKFAAVTVLKGAGSIVALPDGNWSINASGNAGLASAGTGDVLAGSIAALLAQGMQAGPAACLGVHLHGAAADALVERGCGPFGLTASEVTLAARDLLNRWQAGA